MTGTTQAATTHQRGAPVSLLDRALQNADETRAIEFGAGVVGRTGELFVRLFPGKKVLVVADGNTLAAAGQQVLDSLTAAGVEFAADPLVFPGTPTLYASYDNVEIVRERLAELPDTVACSIAAGTLNDLTKLACGELGRPYLNVCTAASVDGYSAYGASITRDGFKITRDCPAPAGLVADLDIMVRAPQRLTATGYGDLIEKIPAGADWILADGLGVEPIDPEVWHLVQDSLGEALGDPAAIAAGDPAAIARLAEGNLLSGLAMQATKSSRPASGAGHQFSHIWEMEGHGLDWEPPLSHGFKVAVGTVASCAIWELALDLDLTRLDVEATVARAPSDASVEARVRAAVPAQLADQAVEVSLAKNLGGDQLRERLAQIQRSWPRIRERVIPQLVTPQQAAAMLRTAGAPHHPALIGIDQSRFRATHFTAHMIRTRYTVLELLADVGQLDTVVGRLFAPSGFWGRHSRPESLGLGAGYPGGQR